MDRWETSIAIAAVVIALAGCNDGARPPVPVAQGSHAGAGLNLKPGQEIAIPMGQAGPVMDRLRAGKAIDPKMLAALAKRDGKPAGGPSNMGLPAAGAMAEGPTAGRPKAAQPTGGRMARQVGLATQKKLQRFYELVTGKPVRVLQAAPESGMWRFMFTVGEGKQMMRQVVYATGDGKRFFEGKGVHLDTELASMKRDKRFASCLADNKVRIFGDPRGKTTVQQLKVVGKFAGMVFIDCSKNPKNCAKLGVKSVPTVAVGRDLHAKVQTRAFLESATGCK